MRKLLSLALFLAALSVSGQQRLFVRVYDLNGHKFAKGRVLEVHDSALLLVGNEAPVNIPVTRIGLIRTKRSMGHNLLLGTLIGAATFATLGALSSHSTTAPGEIDLTDYSPLQGAATGLAIGSGIGGTFGAISLPFKNSNRFIIDGNLNNWKVFQSFVSKH